MRGPRKPTRRLPDDIEEREAFLDHHLHGPRSDYHRVKRLASERFLGVPTRGTKLRLTKVPLEITANLVGVGIAQKRAGRRPCDVPAVTFYVKHKLPKSLLTRRLMLPHTLEGLDCDVVACGRVRFAQGGAPSAPLTPVTPGAQIQARGVEGAGTLGAFVRDADGDTCLLSNCHVLSPDFASANNRPVYQPGIGLAGSRPIARVKTVVPINPSDINRADVALAAMEPGIDIDTEIPDLGYIRETGKPARGVPVAKFGQASLETDGLFDSINADVIVPADFLSAAFVNVCVYRPSEFAEGGDSGSVVMVPETGTAVGLIFAVSQNMTFAISMDAISSALGDLAWLAD